MVRSKKLKSMTDKKDPFTVDKALIQDVRCIIEETRALVAEAVNSGWPVMRFTVFSSTWSMMWATDARNHRRNE
jgi:hypothetical protein